MGKIDVPAEVSSILNHLHSAGFDAYAVGGCVRDSLLGLRPHDWDICTSAKPNEASRVLNQYEILPTGIKHGTITAVVRGDTPSHSSYEITTFRKDGDYYDGRHPDSVEFVTDLKADLSRRDFTINAMAYSEETGVIDHFGGLSDLKAGIIACVGAPDDRFAEDALRMLRALRFASTYGFSIEETTAASIHKNRKRLVNVSGERIQTELVKLLLGKHALPILLDFSDVMAIVIPELQPCIGFQQNSRYHSYTVYGHMAHAVASYAGEDVSVKVALLLHDIGKPLCYTEDERGGHFYGHAALSRDLARQALCRLRFDRKTMSEVDDLIRYHGADIEPTEKAVRRWLNKLGERRLLQLLDVWLADRKAHAESVRELGAERCLSVKRLIATVLEEEQCFSLKDLAVHGEDILLLGVPEGRIVGEVLRYLLEQVICGNLENSADVQLMEAKRYLSKKSLNSHPGFDTINSH